MHDQLGNIRSIVSVSMLVCAIATTARSAELICEAGAYGAPGQDIVVLTAKDWIPAPGLGYLILDGRYGSTLSATSPVTCGAGYVFLTTESFEKIRLEKKDFKRTREEVPVAGAVLVGELLEPTGQGSAAVRPLVVMVHGSETEPAIGNNRAYLLAAQGVNAFGSANHGPQRPRQSEGKTIVESHCNDRFVSLYFWL